MPRSVAALLPDIPIATPFAQGLMSGAQAAAALVPTPIKVVAYVAVPGEAVRTDTTMASFTVTLPADPPDGCLVAVEDAGGIWATNPLLVVTSDGATINGASGATGISFNTANAFRVFRYHSAPDNWCRLVL